ncbi:MULTISPECIES: hypothetical protein [unclassified Halanaerobium]|uniref:hypothetical protein n=1 Tax=unclassified Halanaerobium TaxID=2641197 RepID=UPI000DF404B7|nr:MULTISPECIES: hypothetical protein [unclassified Halanaerobium]RCW48229.1 hypothetical protein DFR78_1092 [Halanaerobium sp. MA284_MarDTE_T2]RCW85655.1 hypothetical protein DER71_1101 [Halanaerobium sp. DL-01]
MNFFRQSFFVVFLIFVLSFVTAVSSTAATGIIPLEQIGEVEKLLYGSPQNIPMVKRIADIEQTVYSEKQSGSIVERAEKIINDVMISSEGEPSLLFLLNTVGWSLNGRVGRGTIVERLENLEMMITGTKGEGPLWDRIKNLYKVSISGKEIPVKKVTIPDDQLIRIKLLESIDSGQSYTGQLIPYEVVNDITIEDSLVIPSGMKGYLKVSDIKSAGKMGKDGDIKISFKKLMQLDGNYLSVELNEEAQEENKSQKLAIGASLLGTALFGLPGVVAGYFVEGEEEKIPAGSEFYIQSNGSQEAFGLLVNND